MAIHLSKNMAQKIVDTVKDVCGHNINFINTDGIIFASTNEKRIGEYHEIGKKVVDTREIIEVETDNDFYGTQKGINIPFIYNNDIIAAIGISGKPDEVRQYAMLAQKITMLLLKEQELDRLNIGKRVQEDYIVRSLTEDNIINQNFLQEFLDRRKLDIIANYRTILIIPDTSHNYSNITVIENEIYKFFRQIPSFMISTNYLSNYRIIINDSDYTSWRDDIYKWGERCKNKLIISVGTSESLHRQHISYSKSTMALKSLSSKKNIAQNIVCYDDLVLEILTSSVPGDTMDAYRDKVISNLSKEEIDLLKAYFLCDMSLQKTSEMLFIHKNTVQYQLKKVENITGYDPRKFTDAVILYMAIYGI